MNPNSPTANKQLIDELTSKFNNISTNDQKQKSTNIRPACGVKARNLKNSHKFLANFINSSRKTAAVTANSTVDDFPCCSTSHPTTEIAEYDTPWGESSKFSSNLTANVKCQLSCKSIGSQGSGTDDSGIYEPPWDGNLLQKLAQNSSNQIQQPQNPSFFDICNEKSIAQKSSHSSSRSSSTKSSKSQQMENCQISRNLLVEKLCDETLKQQQHSFSSSKGTLINVPLIRSVSNCSSPKTRNLRTSNIAEEVYDVPWEFACNKRDFDGKCGTVSRPNSLNPSPNGRTTRLSNGSDRSLNECQTTCRKHRNLTEKVEISSLSDWINPETSLEDEDWYHGNINRQEAESRLQNSSNGSYLVRCCEISDDRYQQELQQLHRPEYALSLKSPQGYLHMKIQLNAKWKWILGYYSYPFDSISNMISYYTINKLPVKGADHICLLKPVAKS